MCQLSIREVRTQLSARLTLGVPRALNFNFVSRACEISLLIGEPQQVTAQVAIKILCFPSSGTKMSVNCLCQWNRTINKCKAFEFL